jgi:hypothetical protein
MQNSFLLQHLEVLSATDLDKFEMFLKSPYYNSREDLIQLFRILKSANFDTETNAISKEDIFGLLYPDKLYSNLDLNNTITHLLKLVKIFLATEHFQKNPTSVANHLIQALRDYHLDEHFERTWQKTHDLHHELPLRNAQWYYTEYILQNEWFKYHSIKSRSWPKNIEIATAALTKGFALDMARWNRTVTTIKNTTQKEIHLPLAAPSLDYLETLPADGIYKLTKQSNLILEKTSVAAEYQEMRMLMKAHIEEISTEESRDFYLATINFCIQQINKGDKTYMHEAFKLYREGLESKALLDRENQISTNTFYNIHVLAHRVGERAWAKQFLDTYQAFLPRQLRENYYQYNLAIYNFMLGDYQKVLDILIEVRFNEIFLNVEVRTMMLRAYFETRAWNALDSLLASFSLFVRRHKELAAYRNHYLNLIKYTKKLLKINVLSIVKRQELLLEVQNTNALADKDWVIGKIEVSLNKS